MSAVQDAVQPTTTYKLSAPSLNYEQREQHACMHAPQHTPSTLYAHQQAHMHAVSKPSAAVEETKVEMPEISLPELSMPDLPDFSAAGASVNGETPAQGLGLCALRAEG